MTNQRGFTLIAAIFLLVVVAGLVAFFVNLRVVQQVTLVYGVQGARAMQAAHSGAEWGAFVALRDNACPGATSFTLGDAVLSDFTISVSCTESTHDESGTAITVFNILSEAETGTYGSLDYVQRGISASVSIAPP